MRKHICLLLEGSYPYVQGGMSEWVKDLIESTPQYDFTIVSIMDSARKPSDFKYTLPSHVKGVLDVNINQPFRSSPFIFSRFRSRKTMRQFMLSVRDSLSDLDQHDFSRMPALVEQFDSSVWDEWDFIREGTLWKVVEEAYGHTHQDESLARFFWVWENCAKTTFRLMRTHLPAVDLYHATSTGYAGFLGALGNTRYGTPLLLSEHGLYLQERQMEVMFHPDIKGIQRTLLERYFEGISRWVYERSSAVTSLCEFIRKQQIELGTMKSKARIIHNGIDYDTFSSIPKVHHSGFHVGFVGRVLPVKDIKLLILAAKELAPSIPGLRISVIGPWDHPGYVKECRDLVQALHLESVVHFTGPKPATQCYGDMDVLVLCSLKEVQPLTIMEAMAAGVPVVATRSGGVPDVLSNAGLVVPPRDLKSLVRAIRKVHNDEKLRQWMVSQGQDRVKNFYNRKQVIAQFHEVYRTNLRGEEWVA